MRKYFSLAQKDRSATVHIFGDITSWEWAENDVSSYTLAKALNGLGEVDTIHVHINSYGGEVSEGLAIYNELRRHKARVITYCDGFACSIASVIFMAGDERVMSNASLLMIHNAWTECVGNANAMRKTAEDLDTITKASVNAYLNTAGIEEPELISMLDAETWLTSEKALEMGFSTSTVNEISTKVSQSIKRALIKMILVSQEDDGAPQAKQDGAEELQEDETLAEDPDAPGDNEDAPEDALENEYAEAAQQWGGFFSAILKTED